MCLNVSYSGVQVGKHFFDMSPIKKDFKQLDASLPLLFSFARMYHYVGSGKRDSLKLNGTHKLLAYTVHLNLLGESIHTVKKNTENLLVTSKDIGLQVNAEKVWVGTISQHKHR